MKALRRILDSVGHHFEKGGRYERLFPLWEAFDTFLYAPGSTTKSGAHVRDALDLKRMMMMVIIAAIPCILMAMYNTGLQANLAIDPAKAGELVGWRHSAERGGCAIFGTESGRGDLTPEGGFGRRRLERVADGW